MAKEIKSSKSSTSATLEVAVDSVDITMDMDPTSNTSAGDAIVAPMFALLEPGNVSLDRSTETKRSRKHELNTKKAVRKPADRFCGSEVHDVSEDEAREAECKARKLEKCKENGTSPMNPRLDRISTNNLAKDKAADGESEAVAPSAEQGPKKKRVHGKKTKNEKRPKPNIDVHKAKKVKAGLITDYNVQVAVTVTEAYIAIDPNYLAKGNINEWVDATADALGNAGKTADFISPIFDVVLTSNGKGKKSPRAVIAYFATEEKLQSALGPIIILGYVTEVCDYRGGKETVFKITIGTWAWQAA